MRARVEISNLATQKISGVGFYTKRLTEALDQVDTLELSTTYFNFLNRQPLPPVETKQPPKINKLFPLRIYAKLQSYNIAPPFDLFFPKVDLTIFPNFATWPCMRSKLRATVIHDLTYIHFPELVEDKNLSHMRRIVPRSIREADFIITVSESVKSELIKEFSMNPKQCIVTPIPPEPSYFQKNTAEIHKKYTIPTKKYLYFLGTLEPRKNIPTLVEAYTRLPKEMKDTYSLVLAGGKGWKTEAIENVIKQAQTAGENIIHIGYVDQQDSSALYQNASLFVMPSTYEGFGMPVAEAMAGQTPVVASDIPVLREIGGDAALYADPHNPDDFRDKIVQVLTQPELAKQLNNSATRQLQKLSWAKNAQTIATYTEALLSANKNSK
jgi:alpha-1,3-rhamnosyl/mannosyltransferase